MAQTRNTKIEKLFTKRTAQYEKATESILSSIDGVIKGIRLYAIDQCLLNPDNELIMMAANLDSETGYIFLAGYFKPNVGTSITLDTGEVIEIETEEDQSIYGKLLRISISPDLIEQNDPAYTCEFILASQAKLQGLMEALTSEEAQDVLAVLDDEVPTTLSESDKKNDAKLAKILEGATNPSGMFN